MDKPIQVEVKFVATAAEWSAGNPVLPLNSIALESDTGREKRADGVTAYNSLRYRNPVSGFGAKVYRGLISQAGTAAPTLTDHFSILSAATLTPGRTGAGVYTFVLTGEFPTAGKVSVYVSLADNATAMIAKAGRTDANTITVKFFNISGTAADLVGDAHLKIEVAA